MITWDDLRCLTCGGRPVDVDPSYFIERHNMLMVTGGPLVKFIDDDIMWTCDKGHKQFMGMRMTKDGSVTVHQEIPT
jgi:hypothetical protein